MAAKKIKKDFDKDKMYSKIMPSIVSPLAQELPKEQPEPSAPGEEEERTSSQAQFVLRNFIEDIVLSKLEHTITMLRCCECERCKKDVMSIALNALPTAYTVVKPDDLTVIVKQLREAYEVKVSAALIKAVQTVKLNPNH